MRPHHPSTALMRFCGKCRHKSRPAWSKWYAMSGIPQFDHVIAWFASDSSTPEFDSGDEMTRPLVANTLTRRLVPAERRQSLGNGRHERIDLATAAAGESLHLDQHDLGIRMQLLPQIG